MQRKALMAAAITGVFAAAETERSSGGQQQGSQSDTSGQQGQSGQSGQGEQTGTGEGNKGQQKQADSDVTGARPDAVTDPAGGAAQGENKKDDGAPNTAQTSSAT